MVSIISTGSRVRPLRLAANGPRTIAGLVLWMMKSRHRKCEVAAERMLLEEPTADLSLAGFPASWGEPQMRVFLGPVGDYDSIRVVKDQNDIPVCLVQMRKGHVPALIAARLKTSSLLAEGLKVVLNSNTTPEVPRSLVGYKFQAEERAALFNLRSQTDLNGSPCTILSYDKEASRWLVRLDLEDPADNEILVSESNLLPLWPKTSTSDNGHSGHSPANEPLEQKDDVMEEAHGETPEQMDGEGERAEDGSDHEQEEARAKASRGKVKASHAVVVTGFPLWDSERITEYFARFGELRTILGADKAKHGKRKLLVAYCRKMNARRSQSRVNGAEVDGFTLQAFFPEDAPKKKGQRRRAPGEGAADE